jgi:uncharacterized LabA/DUF88 family protein
MANSVKIVLWKFSETTKQFNQNTNEIINITYWSKILEYLAKNWNQNLVIPKKIKFKSHEEKWTDVNIALKIFEDAVNDKFDYAIIISWDSDLIPAITSIKKSTSWKKFISVIPFGGSGRNIKHICDKSFEMLKEHLENSIMPKEIDFEWKKIICPYKF